MQKSIALVILLVLVGCSHKGHRGDGRMQPSHGLIQNFGFLQTDSEKFATILNLLHTGAFEVKEKCIWFPGGPRGVSAYGYKLSIQGDSVVVDQSDSQFYDKKFQFESRTIYLKDGTILYLKGSPRDRTNIRMSVYRNHQVVEEKQFDNGKIIEKITCTYDANNNLIEKNRYGTDGLIAERTRYNYDTSNYKFEEVNYWRKSLFSVYQKFDTTFFMNERILNRKNPAGHSAEIYSYRPENADSISVLHYILTYDAKGRRIQEYDIDSQRLAEKIIYSDDIHGHQIQEKIYRWGNLTNTSTWNYDKDGHCIDRNKDFIWKYDSMANLVEVEGPDYHTSYTISYR